MPNKLPPTVIASSVHIGLKPTLLPTTFGYIKLPSICCITINIRINNNDSLGLTVAINIAPITIAIKAPKIGIKAVIDVSKDINKAYGNLIEIIYNLQSIGVISNANKIIDKLDKVLSEN